MADFALDVRLRLVGLVARLGELLLTRCALLGRATVRAAAQLIAQGLKAPALLRNEFLAQALRWMRVRLRERRSVARRKAFIGGLVDEPFRVLWVVRAWMSGHVRYLQGKGKTGLRLI